MSLTRFHVTINPEKENQYEEAPDGLYKKNTRKY
ncbi:hypothetical protein C7423_105336 [Pantoea ananatis]|nr:hypothetical protein C7423_105336 [Pantoea ananatis]